MAYQLEMFRERKKDGESSHVDMDNNYWQKIWQFNIPSFMKHFLWKAGQEILSTMKNLSKKNVVKNDLCLVCTRKEEFVLHALGSYTAIVDVWCYETSFMGKWPNRVPSS